LVFLGLALIYIFTESTLCFSQVHVPRSFGFCILFGRSVFVLFNLIILLSVFRRFPSSAYLFDILKLFFVFKWNNAFVFVCLFVCITFFVLFCFIVLKHEKLKTNMRCGNTTKILTYLQLQSYQADSMGSATQKNEKKLCIGGCVDLINLIELEIRNITY
jgi:hypothetical protein